MAGAHSSKTYRAVIDLTGKLFGRLYVLHKAEPAVRRERSRIYWLCECSCGNRAVVRGTCLRTGHTRSCGCLTEEAKVGNRRAGKHGLWKTPEWQAWSSMRRRCYSPGMTGYENYGGRGITVCERWRQSFTAFLADMGKRPSPEHSLERIDNNGNYEPGNVRWATCAEQNRNRRSTKFITFRGETLCQGEWADRVGISRPLLTFRLKTGWSVEEALTVPPDLGNKRRHRK